jgi:hypothetical protein
LSKRDGGVACTGKVIGDNKESDLASLMCIDRLHRIPFLNGQ